MAKMMLNTPAENTVKQDTLSKGAVKENDEHDIPDSPLAGGLPEWSIEPPAVVVRRKVRTL
jgi:hypothetical protein